MRRNLRLDWRALALLGALLSIIIDWPGLVYAMPTILPAVTVAVAAPKTDTLNLIKNDNILSFFPYEHGPENVAYSVKDEFTGHATETSQSFTTTNRPLSDLQTERTTQEQLPEDRETISVQATETEVQEQRLTTNEKQQVNENIYSISHQNINDTDSKGADDEATAIHQQLHQNSRRNATQHSGTKAEDQTAEEEVPTANTHIMDSTTTTTTPTTSAATATSTPPSNIISSNSNTNAITTTESSIEIQSTLMPSTNTDDDNEEESDEELRSSFQFTSSHHLAILSRTERSIRSSSSSSPTVNTKNLSGAPNGATRSGNAAASGGRGMVRRSSDMSGGAKSKRLNNSRNLHNKNNLDRNERSTVSHLSGPSRKIQLYIKNRFLQLMPDGTVNGTQDDQSEYTILQRSTVDVGRIKIQGVATCLYLCMDSCGAVYGSKDFTDDCVFNENMEQHNYNTYSSTYNSNARRKYYLALNRHGEPRKLQIPPTRSLGKLATYTNAITETVPQERVEQLIAKNFGANRIKHGIRQLCDTGKPLIELVDSKNFKARPKCNPNSSSNSNSNINNNGPSNSRKHSLSNSSSSSSSLAHSNSGQLLNNVPAANDKSKLSTSNSSSSSSSNSHSKPETNSSSSSSSSHNSHSSISNRQNNGHISDSNSSSTTTTANTSTTTTTTNSSSDISSSSSSSSSSNSSSLKASSHHHNGERGKKKLRKCRPHENEEEHHCQRKPQPMRNGGGNPAKQRRCKELLQQQQQAGVTDIVLPPMCHKKGPKKGGPNGKNKRPPGEGRGKNGLGSDGLGPNNRRGKKLNVNGGRQSAKPNQNGGNTNGAKKKQKNPKRGGGGNNKKKQPKTTSTTTSTTEKASSSTHSTSDSTSTLRPGFWETTSIMPSSTLFENYDPHAENTSDRGDREQRNVRYSMEESLEMSSEDTSAANEENGEDDDDLEGDNADDAEDASYEDDPYVPTSSHIPYAEAGDASHTPLTSSADDFLYYDQLDL